MSVTTGVGAAIGGRPELTFEHLSLDAERARSGRWKRSGWLRVVSPAVIITVWQVGTSYGFLDRSTVSSPSTVVSTALDLIHSGELQRDMLASLQRVAIGLGIGVTAGVVLACIAGFLKLGERLIDPPVQMVRTLPVLALAPLFIVWFGIHEEPKLLIIALGTSFPIYINVYGGIRNVDARLVEAGAVLGFNRLEMIRHVIIPGALPQALVGLRLSLGSAWLLLVVAEQINAESGLGHLLDNARTFLRTDVILVVLVIYALLGLSADLIVRTLERTALSWRRSFAGN